MKSWSICRRRRAHNWNGGPLRSREGDWGGKGEGRGQSTSNLGPGWTGVAPHAKEGFQISKRDSRIGEGSSGKGGIIKGVVKGFVPYALIYCQPCIYRALVCMSANKRIVFRL
jgi:hypothetical protein